ncbi:anaerobic C4-dicarboxylate transporter family protein [Luteolibacter luteus]|uniref:Anaerobic C4-dicarboxylate transporter n=1 Tax=Luteolibacter luteus TaxID=2728835 RepID=A0A858RHZ6_9BACT|nr:anaerobic C4-dicarboxylate transporter [Luteolibacter luteus]QJE95703.1 anaerobic C4-dicarboxylate transporter [Luteolibacter luteus]
MSVMLIVHFLVIITALAVGARVGGVGLGLWGGIGLVVLFLMGVAPTGPPVDVMLIILAVIMAASVMEAAGGIQFLVRVAEKIIRKNPKQVTIVAPLTTYAFTFLAGTGHIVYPLLPVIYEVAHQNGIRPERPMAIATIASQQAITASPVAAATAAMIGLFHSQNLPWGLPQILMICVPATLSGVIVAALVQTRVGKELSEDPEYQALLAAGKIPAPVKAGEAEALPKSARTSAIIFLIGVAFVVVLGLVPSLRTLEGADGKPISVPMPVAIEMVMLAVAAASMTICKVKPDLIPQTSTCRAGITAVVGIFGLAWMGDTFIAAHKDEIIGGLGGMAKAAPWSFAFGLFFASVLLYSQAATARALMPLGLSLGIAPPFLIGMFPAVNGYFLIPNYGTIIAAINFDRSGTTRIGKYVINHSFLLPGLVSTTVAVVVGLLIGKIMA